ncbi:proteinase-activated receptor 1-like [Paramacrobiotus metropolitanus]|uniref:proteinase-activated receptor 1-like n=1 Tax=Paramacrobiotus metropolitanus TaxID=2943436 RepID=UPI0024460817|nr:proteinase-activated receptor 1-like [Paramacrobiotus metropolitanus]
MGTLLNALLFAAIVTSGKLRQGSGVLIAHSIFLETVLCAIAFPLIVASTYRPQNSMTSVPMCRFTMLVFYGVMWTENWASVIIGINRFVAIFFPHGYNLIRKKQATTMPWGACGARPISAVYGIVTILTTPLPVATLGFLYVSIFSAIFIRNAMSRRKTDPGGAPGNKKPHGIIHKRLKTARMMFTSYIWFSLCYLPAPVASSVAPVAYSSSPLISLFLRLLLLCGYATSPIIYLSMNEEYRRRAKKILMKIGGIWSPQLRKESELTTFKSDNRTKETTANAID